MKELYDFDKTLKSLTEEMDQSQIASNDFGAEKPVVWPESKEKEAFIDQVFSDMVAEVMVHGYNEAQAKKYVNEALKDIVDQGLVSDIPEETDSDGVKITWVVNARPKILAYLKMNGVIM